MTYSDLYLSGGTDLQRLLKNIKPDTPRPRRCGRTYSTLLLMAGQVFYGPHNAAYVYVGQTTQICKQLQDEFLTIVKGKGVVKAFGSTHGRVYVPDEGQLYIFATLDSWRKQLGGGRIEMSFIDIEYSPSHVMQIKEISDISITTHYG